MSVSPKTSQHTLAPEQAATREEMHQRPEEILAPTITTSVTAPSPVSNEPPHISPSSLAAPTFSATAADGTPITASSSGTPLVHPIPIKPRSNSNLQSSRPAPPSPAPSRPSSQVYSPQLLATGFPSPSSASRDRASSTSSSRGGRRQSTSSHPSRTSSKPRPRSALGASSFLPQGDDSGNANATAADSSLAASTIPEDAVPAQPKKPLREEDRIVIRDFAFSEGDPRFAGPGYPLCAPDEPETTSRRSSRWNFNDPSEPSSSTSQRKNSWSGFGLLSWRGLMNRRRSSEAQDSTAPDDDDDFAVTAPDHEADDYAFSDSEDASEDEREPWGFYRAAFAFEAMGEHEIALEEGTIVEVRGRGGGDGWVVAVKRRLDSDGRVVRLDEAEEGEGKEGLVPESYLEKAGELEIATPTVVMVDSPDSEGRHSAPPGEEKTGGGATTTTA